MSASAKTTPAGWRNERLVHRLHRIAGQIRGLERMVEEGRDPIAIITQAAAADSALESFALEVLNAHVRERVVALAEASDDARRDDLEAILQAVQRFARTR